MRQTNWSGNLTYSSQVIAVDSIEQLQQVIRTHDEVKVVATGHTFNDIADSNVALVSLKTLNRVLEINEAEQSVAIEAGVRYGELAITLHEAGFALHNLASLPHISVVGACATGTHGSGVNNGNLATAVVGIEFIDSEGNLQRIKQEDDNFSGFPVNLGALGIITQMTLKIEPTYDVRQTVFLDLPMDEYINNFEAVMSAGYSVSAFTHWRDKMIKQVWVKQKADEIAITELFGAIPADRHYNPIADVSAENATPQMGTVGAWHDRLPHFQLAFTPSKGDELQSECFIDRKYMKEAIEAMYSIGDELAKVLLVSEIRCVAEDDLWMSPCYQQDSIVFHFTWTQDWQAVREALVQIETALEPFAPRPHLGKLFTMSSEIVRSRYPRFDDFKQLVLDNDLNGKFRNRFLTELLG